MVSFNLFSKVYFEFSAFNVISLVAFAAKEKYYTSRIIVFLYV